jgi:peptidoglycan/LPS O-acetylase OafA/YrhL
MGSLRTLFAIAVVLAHSWPGGTAFVGGRNAVQLFYVISGFLISYVLVEKKAYPKIRDFYINRYLRLYPIYFCVAVLTLCAYSLYSFIFSTPGHFFTVYESAPLSADVMLTVSNVFLFGQDWIMFLGVKNHALVFTKYFYESDVALYHGLIAAQAWTLGVELTFYLVAPFVLPRRKIIFLLLALSLGLRVYFISIGIGLNDPWSYRFFPTELALFLFGALSHQILLPLYKKRLSQQLEFLSSAATYLLIAVSVLYCLIPIDDSWKTMGLLSMFVVLVPMTFIFQRRYRFDNWIGNLSYPIYIGHTFVIFLMEFVLRKMQVENQYVVSIICLILAIAFAIGLDKWIGKPFEKIRNRFRGVPKALRAAPMVAVS